MRGSPRPQHPAGALHVPLCPHIAPSPLSGAACRPRRASNPQPPELPALRRPPAAPHGRRRAPADDARRAGSGSRVPPRPGMAQLGAAAALCLGCLAAAFLSAIHKIEEGHIGVYYR